MEAAMIAVAIGYSLNIAVVSKTVGLPIYDKLYRRVMNFIHSCLHCDSYFAKSIVLIHSRYRADTDVK